MQEKVRGLFVAATANRIDLLPAEMIRKGRFDEVFFVDLPHDKERLEIFAIHLERRGDDPGGFDIDAAHRADQGLDRRRDRAVRRVGDHPRELESRALTFDDLLRAAARIVPLSKTMKEQVDHIRNWARDRAAPASPSGVGL